MKLTRGDWVHLLLLWLGGLDIRLTMLAVPPLVPLIHRDLHLDGHGSGVMHVQLDGNADIDVKGQATVNEDSSKVSVDDGGDLTRESLSGDNVRTRVDATVMEPAPLHDSLLTSADFFARFVAPALGGGAPVAQPALIGRIFVNY